MEDVVARNPADQRLKSGNERMRRDGVDSIQQDARWGDGSRMTAQRRTGRSWLALILLIRRGRRHVVTG